LLWCMVLTLLVLLGCYQQVLCQMIYLIVINCIFILFG
jgi:Zn-dependent protease